MRRLIAATWVPFLALAGTAPAQSLVAHYRLDATSGTFAADSSGTGHDGTFSGGFTLAQPGAAAGTATSVHFDGVDGAALVQDTAILNALRSDLTVAAWVRPDAYVTYQRFFGNVNGWAFGMINTDLLFTTRGIQDFFSGVSIPLNTWLHVVVVFDATFDATFYLDGANVGTVNGSSPSGNPAVTWAVAGLSDHSEYFNGRIDDLQIYAGSLTDAQVQFLHDNPGVSITVGSPYCISAPNSTGSAAEISAGGGTSVSANSLVLFAEPVPDQNGLFFYGASQVQVPFGDGFLCVGGPFQRMSLITASGNRLAYNVDFTTPATLAGAITPGTTWEFQAWFQDPAAGGTGVNLSNGLELVFSP